MLGFLLLRLMMRWSLVQLLLTDGAMRRIAGLGFKIAPYTGVAVLAGRFGRDIGHDDDSGSRQAYLLGGIDDRLEHK